MFHGVGDSSLPVTSFEDILDMLARNFRFGTLEDLLASRHGHNRPMVCLTFDDGLRNNHTHAYPVLRQRSIPATFYVCPALIEAGSWLWTHEMRERLRTLGERQLAELSRELLQAELGREQMISVMKGLGVSARLRVEEQIRLATPGFVPDQAQRLAFDLMNWDELRQLDPGLITIGSHTMTHAMLDSVTPEEAEHEVVTSRKVLETKLDREVSHFCYPAGQVGPVAEALVRRTYRTATLTARGSTPRETMDPYRLPRLSGTACRDRTVWALFRAPKTMSIPGTT